MSPLPQSNPPPPAPIRLNKALALAGVCSRRRADELISSGKVFVNGRVVRELGSLVQIETDQILVDGKEVTIPRPAETHHQYVLLHKPVHCVTTVKDPQGRQTVMDLLPAELNKARIFPVGRLDYMSEGLLLLTTDGELAYRLTHARWHVEKEYIVDVRGPCPDHLVQSMVQGVALKDGTRLSAISAEVVSRQGDKTRLRLILIQGLNRHIRKMCEALGLVVLRLTRVRQGPIKIGRLSQGKWRPLTPSEVAALKSRVGFKSG